MKIDRNSIVLFLQNVRDLEVSQYILESRQAQEKQFYENKISSIQTKPHYKSYQLPSSNDQEGVFSFCLIGLAFEILTTILICVTGMMNGFYAFCFIIGFLAFAIGAGCNIPDSEEEKERLKKSQEPEITKYNDEQYRIAQKGVYLKQSLNNEWTQKNNWYNSEITKVETLKNQFYSMNILEYDYRNLESTIYLYRYMRSGQGSFEEAKNHEHLERGIKQILSKLDQISSSIGNLIYETRCVNDQNRYLIQQTIQQNDQMLTHLQSISSNSQEAAYYSQLSSYYSKANAYFSLANYLKHR